MQLLCAFPYADKMLKPKLCPVCAAEELVPVMRKPISPATDDDHPAVSGVLAYRCSNGHCFTVVDNESRDREVAAD